METMKSSWKSRVTVRRTLPSAALLVALTAAGALCAQSLQPTSENGRTVWTNDGPAHSAAQAPEHRATRQSQLSYWSNVEHCWKPIRSASPAAIRSARAVAGEVSSYMESRPRMDAVPPRVNGEGAQATAADHSVSAADIDRYIEDASSRHHVDPELVRALVKVESNFNAHAVSSKGAMGLMQLMPATARRYAVHNPFDAAQNVDAGVRHLKGLLENFRGDVSLSLAAYNAGQGAVERSRGIPPYTETRNYVKRITSLMGSASPAVLSGMPVPIHIRRDERGRLVITNTD